MLEESPSCNSASCFLSRAANVGSLSFKGTCSWLHESPCYPSLDGRKPAEQIGNFQALLCHRRGIPMDFGMFLKEILEKVDEKTLDQVGLDGIHGYELLEVKRPCYPGGMMFGRPCFVWDPLAFQGTNVTLRGCRCHGC